MPFGVLPGWAEEVGELMVGEDEGEFELPNEEVVPRGGQLLGSFEFGVYDVGEVAHD